MKNTLKKLITRIGVFFIGVFFLFSNVQAAGLFHQFSGGADYSNGTFTCTQPYGSSVYVRTDNSTVTDITALQATIASGGGSGFQGPGNVCNDSAQITQINNAFAGATEPYLLITIATNPSAGDWSYWLMNVSTGLQVYTSEASTSIPFDASLGSATTTLSANFNFLQFVNVPALLQAKVPFAYIFQISEGIKSGLQSSSTSAIPSGTFVWSSISGATTSIDMFSTDTIEHYLSPTLISLWRGFLLVVLYVEFGYVLYNRAKSQHLI